MEKPTPNSPTCTSNEEDEDTLSLSGLFMYSDKNIEFWVADRRLSQDLDQDFEFSSEMMITSNDSSNPGVVQVTPQNIERKKRDHVGLGSKTKSRWYVFMFGFGSSKYPKKIHIRDLRERQTSFKWKLCGDRDHGRSRSTGFIRFLGCGGVGTEIDHHEIPCQLYYCKHGS